MLNCVGARRSRDLKMDQRCEKVWRVGAGLEKQKMERRSGLVLLLTIQTILNCIQQLSEGENSRVGCSANLKGCHLKRCCYDALSGQM